MLGVLREERGGEGLGWRGRLEGKERARRLWVTMVSVIMYGGSAV